MVIDNVHKGLILGGLKKVNQLFVDARELKEGPAMLKMALTLKSMSIKNPTLRKSL